MENKVNKIIKIPINEVKGNMKLFNYGLLASYFLIFIMLIFRIAKFDDSYFFVVFVMSIFVVVGNIQSFKSIEKELKQIKYNLEIEQLTKIIDSEAQNADAYFARGESKKEMKKYQSAYYDFKEAQNLKNKLSNELEYFLADEMEDCKKKLQKIK